MINKNLNLNKLKQKQINFRKFLIKNTNLNISEITRLSYDLQSGSYIKSYNILKKNKKKYNIFYENMKNLIKNIKGKEVKTILDFGTGEGIKLPYILRFSKKIKKIYACDISFNRLCYAYDFLKKELSQKKLSKIFLFCNKDFELPFKSNSIDVVYVTGVLENMSNRRMNDLILELLRVTKKRLILNEPRKNDITKTDLIRLKKYKLNFNLNYILKKNKIHFKEIKWHPIEANRTKYSMRIINKNAKSLNDTKLYLKNENYPLIKKDNFFYSRSGKIFPVLNQITIFRPLKDLNFFK